jgi:hypothetical protein
MPNMDPHTRVGFSAHGSFKRSDFGFGGEQWDTYDEFDACGFQSRIAGRLRQLHRRDRSISFDEKGHVTPAFAAPLVLRLFAIRLFEKFANRQID